MLPTNNPNEYFPIGKYMLQEIMKNCSLMIFYSEITYSKSPKKNKKNYKILPKLTTKAPNRHQLTSA